MVVMKSKNQLKNPSIFVNLSEEFTGDYLKGAAAAAPDNDF
jgi:hypothetical protein